MSLYQLPADKAQHWFYGSVISCSVAVITISITHNPVIAGLLALAMTGVFAVAKEKFDDKAVEDSADSKDIIATLAGGAMVAIPLIISTLV
jgi:hypothetical protein